MSDSSTEQAAADAVRRQRAGVGWHALGWVLLGILAGAALLALFISYGQPELLLEQLNLRYCG